MKKYIRAMTMKRADLGALLEDHTFPMMCAIAQLYLFQNAQDRNHWRKEVWSNLNSIKLLRGSKKLPSAQFILDNTWNLNKSFVKSAIDWAIDHDESLIPRDNVNIAKLSNIMESYFKWLANELSQWRYVAAKDVYNKLDELGL